MVFFWILVALVGYTVFVLPSRIAGEVAPLRDEIKKLRRDLDALRGQGYVVPEPATDIESQKITSPWATSVPVTAPVSTKEYDWSDFDGGDDVSPSVASQEERPVASSPASEWNIGAKLPVWIGSVSLILAAVFLVKYSVDAGWFGPTIRVALNLVFGCVLMAGGYKLFEKPNIPNVRRISQGLVGAGIVALYAGFYSAVHVHHLIAPAMGFSGMAVVTVLSILLSLRHGQPIAVFGLIGGMLTPALIGSDTPNPAGLFSYLFLLTGGMVVVMARRAWWGMAIFALGGAFLWTLYWLVSGFAAGSEGIVAMFAVALMGSILFATADALRQNDDTVEPNTLNLIGLAGTALVFLVIQQKLTLGAFELSMVGLLSAATLILAWFRPGIYRWAVVAKAVLDVILVTLWIQDVALVQGLAALSGLSVLYILAPYGFMRHSDDPRPWAALQAGAAIAIYLVGYACLDVTPSFQENFGWGGLALFGAAFFAHQASVWKDTRDMLAVYAVGATSFLSIGLAIEMPDEWLPLAYATEVCALLWIAGKLDKPVLAKIGAAMAGVFAIAISGQVLLFADTICMSVFGDKAQIFTEMELTLPVLKLGLPAVLFAVATWMALRLKNISDDVRTVLGGITIALVLMTGYYGLRGMFHINDAIFMAKAGFIERAVVTVFLFLCAEGLQRLGAKWGKVSLERCGAVLFHVTMARMAYFDLLLYNPYLHDLQNVGHLPVMNGVTLVYGVGLIVAARAVLSYTPAMEEGMRTVYKALSMIFLFALVSLSVRQHFHGADLRNGDMSMTEFYSYSIIWLLTGLALLGAGIRRNIKTLRLAAVGFLLLTIGKVFLFDAAVLEGLMRVFSFLGLGLSLIGLSAFYTRFITTHTSKDSERADGQE